jgi:alanine racemase
MTIAGNLVPVIGRVSMDITVLDVTSLIEKGITVRPDDEVVIIDNDRKAPNSVESLAQMLDTIPYDITTSLGQRVIKKNRACCTMIFESNHWIRWLSGADGSIFCFPNTFS